MEISLFWLKFFGLMYAAIGLAIILHRNDAMAMISALVDPERSYRVRLVALIPLTFGLLILLTHNSWETLPYGILSFIGWAALLKGLFNLLAPSVSVQGALRLSKTETLYTIGGWFAFLLGIYLAAAGYGII